MTTETKSTLEFWAVVELFGHNTIAGFVTEQTIGGGAFVRVDVPEVAGQSAFTKLYGDKAIYAITPCTEEIARHAASKLVVRPVLTYMLPDRQSVLVDSMSAGARSYLDTYGEDDDEDDDPSASGTCETCGGDYWPGGTNCTCDDDGDDVDRDNPF